MAEHLGLALGLNEIALAWLLVPALILPGFLLVRSIQPDPKQMALEPARYYPAWALQGTASASEGLEQKTWPASGRRPSSRRSRCKGRWS